MLFSFASAFNLHAEGYGFRDLFLVDLVNSLFIDHDIDQWDVTCYKCNHINLTSKHILADSFNFQYSWWRNTMIHCKMLGVLETHNICKILKFTLNIETWMSIRFIAKFNQIPLTVYWVREQNFTVYLRFAWWICLSLCLSLVSSKISGNTAAFWWKAGQVCRTILNFDLVLFCNLEHF